QLEKARVEIDRLSAEHTASKELAATLQTEADKLLIEAESLDDVTGFKPFKRGMNTQRKADIVRLSAVESQLASELIEARKVDDATAELEAIAKQLLSIRYSMELLGNYRQASREGAGELRRLADVRDSDAARVMSNAIDSANEVLERWSASIELMQQAIKSQGRSSSRDKLSKAATDSWRLDVTWALGQMQESQGQFIAQKYDALTEILTAGIVTGTSKWEALASTCSDQLESAIASAITAYEEAKSVARSLGRDGESALYQLEIRLSNLTGTALPDSQQNTQVPPAPNTPSSVTNNAGFTTPQELVAFMKDALMSKSSIDLTKIYETKTAEHENMLGTLQKLLDNMTALSKLIDSSFGEGSSNKISTLSDGLLPSSIDESLINMQGDNKATLALEGITVSLNKTNRGWLIDFDSQLQAEGLDQQKFSQVETMIKAFKKVADQIKSGEISDYSQVEFAIMTAMMGG
ncbi:MAG: hypothetical protein QF444_06160, partial [Phycisphaerales bacterium]|nr:hypothetical protein [Phycisphaerales bacterium]